MPRRVPPPTATSLTQNCLSANQPVPFNSNGPTLVTMTGKLAGAPAGSTVTVTFKHPDRTVGGVPVAGPVETVQATTNPSGDWSASWSTTNRQDIGTWQASSSFPRNGAVRGLVGPGVPGDRGQPQLLTDDQSTSAPFEGRRCGLRPGEGRRYVGCSRPRAVRPRRQRTKRTTAATTMSAATA